MLRLSLAQISALPLRGLLRGCAKTGPRLSPKPGPIARDDGPHRGQCWAPLFPMSGPGIGGGRRQRRAEWGWLQAVTAGGAPFLFGPL